MQIAIGALLAWPTFGLHVEFDPELFLVLFIPPLLFADGWKTPTREFLEHGREIFGGAGAGGGHRGRDWFSDSLGRTGDPAHTRLCAGRRAVAYRRRGAVRHCGRRAHSKENHGHFAGRGADERRLWRSP